MLVNKRNSGFMQWLSFSGFPILLLLSQLGCGTDNTGIENTPQSAAQPPSISIDKFSCETLVDDDKCRDIGTVVVSYSVTDSEGFDIVGELYSESLGQRVNMLQNGNELSASLIQLSGANDLSVSVSVMSSSTTLAADTLVIGQVLPNTPPSCSLAQTSQDFLQDENAGSVALIDLNSCVDLDGDLIRLINNDLNTTIVGPYAQNVIVEDEYLAQSQYALSGNISPRNLTRPEFVNALVSNPSAIGADTCFLPINGVFDEVLVCDFSSQWLGVQYNSSVSTLGFTNVALTNSAQGFINFPAGVSLANIVSGFVVSDLPVNQVSSTPGNSGIVITAQLDRDVSGNYSNFTSSGAFLLQGSNPDVISVDCENQNYSLPLNIQVSAREAQLMIDQAFVESVAMSTSISNCQATHQNGLVTDLEGTIEIVINDQLNQNPTVNSVIGLNAGFEGIRTVEANVTDPDGNIGTVELRYRETNSSAPWTSTVLTAQAGTDNYSAAINFNYATTLAESGGIEYQVIANDLLGGQGTSNLASVNFDANETTAQSIIQQELTLDSMKITTCVDCSFVNPADGATIGPFDTLFSDPAGSDHAYEYNGEQRTAAQMSSLAASVSGTSYDFFEIPIGSIAAIRLAIQNN